MHGRPTSPAGRGPRRRLRRALPLALAVAGLVPLLAACMGRGDTTPPIVGITDPKSGTIRPADNLTITGYAMDDFGVASIKINGTDVLSNPAYAGERGKRLVRFRFTVGGLKDGEVTTHIVVADVNGHTSTLDYHLTIDNTPPTVQLTTVQALPDGQVHVVGEAKDNNRVASITINGQPLAITPGPDVPFSVDVPSLKNGTVVVEDSAGNKVTKPL